MKKLVCMALALFMLAGLAACTDSKADGSTAQSADSVPDSEAERLNGLLSEAEEENSSIASEAEEEKAKLQDEINKLETRLDNNENGIVTQTVFVKRHTYLTVTENYTPADKTRKAYTVYVSYEDGTVTEVLNHGYIWTVKVSPDGSKIVMNDLQGEEDATVFLYDVNKRTTRVLDMTKLPADTTAAFTDWLDDRYFLFVVQGDCGSVVRGGDVWLYDTDTDEYKPVIVNSDKRFQTVDFNVYRKATDEFNSDFVMFNSGLYDISMNFMDNKHHILAFTELTNLFNGGKTVDLSALEPLNAETQPDASGLDYTEIVNGNSKTGVFLSRDTAAGKSYTTYAYVEAWDKYFPIITGYYVSPDLYGCIFGASADADTAWITYADPSTDYSVIKTFRLTRESGTVETASFDTGTERDGVYGMFTGFYDGSNGALFIADDDNEWKLTVLKTDNGGKTWSVTENNGVLSSTAHESPLTAKFVSADVGIVAYRYFGNGDFRTRTYLTTDGGATFALLSGLENKYVDDSRYTEAVNLTLDGDVYTLTVSVNGDGAEQSTVIYRSENLLVWESDK